MGFFSNFRLWSNKDPALAKFGLGMYGRHGKGGKSGGPPKATSQYPASAKGSTGPKWDPEAWKQSLGYLQKRAAGGGLISQQQAALQQQKLQQTLTGQIGAGYDPAQARAALMSAGQAGADIAGSAAVAGAQEQLGYQQALSNALLGGGKLSAESVAQQNALYMQGQKQRQEAEQAALQRALAQKMQSQRLQYDLYGRLIGGAMMSQAAQRYGSSGSY